MLKSSERNPDDSMERLQRRIEVLEAQLKKERSEAQTLRRQVEQFRASQEELFATTAHELRNPLASALGFAELLMQDGHNEQTCKRGLAVIRQKLDQVARVIEDMYQSARLEAGARAPLNLEYCDLGATLNEFMGQFQWEHLRYFFELDLPATTVLCLIDRSKILRILENLLSNAVKYSPAGGLVKVGAQRCDEGILVWVEDQGQGMTQEQAGQAFDKYYRVNPQGAVAGLGLGLTICKTLVEAHGGKIWIESRPQQGTRVLFTLPPDAVRLPPPRLRKHHKTGDGQD